MGAEQSICLNNDEMVDKLLNNDFIKTPIIERVFRAVDRGDYFLDEARQNAYKDLAWKSGDLHLSAPSTYSEVMERLSLAPGLSFLNLGSGTGYLSTIAGLILGPYGINDGIEIHHVVVQYANAKLQTFLKCSAALDEFEFCPPRFITGNCLFLNSDFPLYDRVYCGAACPSIYKNYMKDLIKVGGILVVVMKDTLLTITRTSETIWEEKKTLSLYFPPLNFLFTGIVKREPIQPLTLKEICRSTIRTTLRKTIETEQPSIKETNRKTPENPNKKSRREMPILRGAFLETRANVTNEKYVLDLLNSVTDHSDWETDTDSDSNVESSSEESVGTSRNIEPFVSGEQNVNLIDNGSDIMETDQQIATQLEYRNTYTAFMRAKIQQLPIPEKLKSFLNLNREFQ